MKVLMINSVSGYGSTGSICVDIANILEEQGHECYIAYGQLSSKYPKSFRIGTPLENKLHNVGSRVFGKQGYFTKNGTEKLVEFIKNYNPDIVHLHNVHGNYLNLETLFSYLKDFEKRVVWTLHDCWAFTGKCSHYTDISCYKWKSLCNSCPQLHTYPPSIFFDYSKEMFLDKKKWFTSIENMTVIPVSHWLSGEVKESFLNKYPIETIYNWVDHSIFKETIDVEFIKKYNIDTDKFNIILVSAGWHVNDVKYIDALRLSTIIRDDMQIIMIGNVISPELLPENIKHISYLEGKEELAKAYSIGDVYVHLSTEDTFGKVIAEAMSCGTPAIVYNSTACPEIVGTDCGYVVAKRNVDEIFNSVLKIKNKTRTSFSQYCRRRVIEKFNLETNIDLTIKIYEKTLENVG